MRLYQWMYTLMIAFLSARAHSLTIPISNHTSALLIQGDIECLPKSSPWYSRKVPIYYDCKYAIEHLPDLPGFGAFRKCYVHFVTSLHVPTQSFRRGHGVRDDALLFNHVLPLKIISPDRDTLTLKLRRQSWATRSIQATSLVLIRNLYSADRAGCGLCGAEWFLVGYS